MQSYISNKEGVSLIFWHCCHMFNLCVCESRFLSSSFILCGIFPPFTKRATDSLRVINIFIPPILHPTEMVYLLWAVVSSSLNSHCCDATLSAEKFHFNPPLKLLVLLYATWRLKGGKSLPFQPVQRRYCVCLFLCTDAKMITNFAEALILISFLFHCHSVGPIKSKCVWVVLHWVCECAWYT